MPQSVSSFTEFPHILSISRSHTHTSTHCDYHPNAHLARYTSPCDLPAEYTPRITRTTRLTHSAAVINVATCQPGSPPPQPTHSPRHHVCPARHSFHSSRVVRDHPARPTDGPRTSTLRGSPDRSARPTRSPGSPPVGL